MKTATLKSVFTAVFAALICAGSVIAIPLGPIPIVLQNAFAILSGLLLGPLQGAGAVGLFLIAGFLGLPVFSGGKSGIVAITGPTGDT
nr:biotin transporter BioY [Brucepastera parasyntrophica]